jgi:hypothetical protein
MDAPRYRWGDREPGGYDASEFVRQVMAKMTDEPQYNRGGWLPCRPVRVRLHEGEGIRDQQGRLRAMVIGGRLVRFPLWLSNLLPRVPGR